MNMIRTLSNLSAVLVLTVLLCGDIAAMDVFPEKNDSAGDAFYGNRVAFFCQAGLSMELNAAAMKSIVELSNLFMELGRFYPVEPQKTAADQVTGPGDFDKKARDLGCGLYAVIYIDRRGDTYLATISFHSLKDEYSSLSRQIALRTSVLNNIPLKLAREAAYIHQDLPLKASVVESGQGKALVTAGQWHGLTPGRYATDRGPIEVIGVTRYTSLVKTGSALEPGSSLVINVFPGYKASVRRLEANIDRNTMFHFTPGPEAYKGDDPGKRFAKALCVINNGASLVVPGYGSYLACGYLGVKKKVSIPNVVLTVALVFTQFTLTEMMTEFKTNFAPWIRDSDKTVAVQNLQIFCWSSLLSTYAASFLDQLSYQYTLEKKLPPFFEHRNTAAAFLSLLVPGGGLFYKGFRIAGWSFYFAEMALAGYGAWSTGHDRNFRYAFSALALVKAVDILCAYLLEPTYAVYRSERERQINRATVSVNIVPDHQGKSVVTVSCGMRF